MLNQVLDGDCLQLYLDQIIFRGKLIHKHADYCRGLKNFHLHLIDTSMQEPIIEPVHLKMKDTQIKCLKIDDILSLIM